MAAVRVCYETGDAAPGAIVPLSDLDITLSLPYNHDPAYPQWLDGAAEGVSEVYFPIHADFARTARPWAGPTAVTDYRAELRRLADVLARHGITPNLVVNLPVWDDSRPLVTGEVGVMSELFGPTLVVTLSDYPLARDLRGAFPDLHLGVSCAAQIATARHARYWIDGVGARDIVISREINRRPRAIAAVRSQGARIKMVLDDSCLSECPSMLSHTALMMVCDASGGGAPCMMQEERDARPWLVALKDVVPALLPRYAGLVDVAKIEGRARSLDEIARKRQLYLETSSWAHPHGDYVEPPDAFDRIAQCGRVCEDCGWCAEAFAAVSA